MSQDKQKSPSKTSHIPSFKSYTEEAEFWDTHDFTAFEHETHPVEIRFTKTYSENVQVRFDPETSKKLEQAAREVGLKKSTLIRNWVMERLQEQGKHAS